MTWTKKILPLAAVLAVALPAGNAMAAPKAKFRFSAPSYVTQEGGTATVTVTREARRGAARTNSVASVNWAITGGSATNGTDYTTDIAAGRLTFQKGEATKDITFTIKQDFDIEGLETIGLSLSGATNALITSPKTAQVLIADDDGPTQIQLVPATQSVNESVGTANFFAVRSGDITGASSVAYATSDGTATQPDDYTSTSGTASFGLGEFQKPIAVPVIDDSTVENPETFSVGLSNVTGATLGNASSTVTIVDNDSRPVFALDASSYSVNEDGTVDVTVQRLGDATTPTPVSPNDVFNVTWGTTDGTATNPADYVPAADNQLDFDSTDDSETITISATDAGTQIGLVDDKLVEGDETFGIALTSAAIAPGGSGATPSLGSPSSATVTIHDNDTASGGGDNNGGGGNTGGDNTGGTGGTGGTPTGPVVAVEGPGQQVVLGARQAACGLTTKAAKKQKLLKQKSLRLSLKSAQACKVTITSTIKQVKAKKKRSAKSARVLTFKGKKAALTLQPNKAKTVKVKFSKKTLAAIKKALKARKQLVATVVVTTRDSASKVSRKTLKITIRR